MNLAGLRVCVKCKTKPAGFEVRNLVTGSLSDLCAGCLRRTLDTVERMLAAVTN